MSCQVVLLNAGALPVLSTSNPACKIACKLHAILYSSFSGTLHNGKSTRPIGFSKVLTVNLAIQNLADLSKSPT